MLRDPVKNFESEFGFFRDYPFPQWVGINGTLDIFMQSPEKYYNKNTPWYFRFVNKKNFHKKKFTKKIFTKKMFTKKFLQTKFLQKKFVQKSFYKKF